MDHVSAEGHDVPGYVVKRRYQAGLSNLFNIYIPLADSWQILDNSGTRPRSLAAGERSATTAVHDAVMWAY
jgi:predicted ABC-type ATPase